MSVFRSQIMLFFIILLWNVQIIQPMQGDAIQDLVADLAELNLNDYYSDSEDEEGYTYKGLPALEIDEEKQGKKCIALVRGIHFSPSKFSREEISEMRKKNDAGDDIFSSAAYDLADEPLASADNKESVSEKAMEIREHIASLSPSARHRFQQLYSNQYHKFHEYLGTDKEGGIFKPFASGENPQVSTGENFFHSHKYASGLKVLGLESLDPEYDAKGKPKHPYLGKLFVILASTDELEELAPYFVVHGHANDDITIFYHFSNNVLEEREVSFPGLIPGHCVVLSMPVRVPSFEGDYKPWYKEKFGLTKRAYMARKKILTTGKYFKDETDDSVEIKKKTVKSLLEKVILPHASETLKKHIISTCEEKNIQVVWKQLDGTFDATLPPIPNANNLKNLIKQQKAAQAKA